MRKLHILYSKKTKIFIVILQKMLKETFTSFLVLIPYNDFVFYIWCSRLMLLMLGILASLVFSALISKHVWRVSLNGVVKMEKHSPRIRLCYMLTYCSALKLFSIHLWNDTSVFSKVTSLYFQKFFLSSYYGNLSILSKRKQYFILYSLVYFI